jgi:hypothetical protein
MRTYAAVVVTIGEKADLTILTDDGPFNAALILLEAGRYQEAAELLKPAGVCVARGAAKHGAARRPVRIGIP